MATVRGRGWRADEFRRRPQRSARPALVEQLSCQLDVRRAGQSNGPRRSEEVSQPCGLDSWLARCLGIRCALEKFCRFPPAPSCNSDPSVVVVSLLACHLGEPGSIPGGRSLVGIVTDDAAGRRVFSRISRFPRPCIPAPLHTRLAPPSLALETSMLKAVQISPLRISSVAGSLTVAFCSSDLGHKVTSSEGCTGYFCPQLGAAGLTAVRRIHQSSVRQTSVCRFRPSVESVTIDSELQCQTVSPDFVIIGFSGSPPTMRVPASRHSRSPPINLRYVSRPSHIVLATAIVSLAIASRDRPSIAIWLASHRAPSARLRTSTVQGLVLRHTAELYAKDKDTPLYLCMKKPVNHVIHTRGRGGYVVRLPASHHGETGYIPFQVTPGFSQVEIDVTVRRIYSEISRLPHPCILTLLHSHLISP
ncbi:hypothetical protein PR048_014631 [Dryococelus australis]|uniref:Uncharacterized protein n=1 Tax=Dryococelus australis TaxID=614101 RepID=A0ABQ9HEZ4_9NEOP|nr:hypothetical protein PR048_014631 [Dryococelus australis]